MGGERGCILPAPLPQATFRKLQERVSNTKHANLRRIQSSGASHFPIHTPHSTLRLPDKVAADPEGRLVFFGHTDVAMLNNVVELWRYPSAQSCIK